MRTVKPSAASRSATAAQIPRDAPVTIATLLVGVVILSLLIVSWAVSDGSKLGPFIFRIIRHYPASQSAGYEQSNGPIRCNAGVHAGGGAAQLHAGSGGSRPAPLDRDGCGQTA